MPRAVEPGRDHLDRAAAALGGRRDPQRDHHRGQDKAKRTHGTSSSEDVGPRHPLIRRYRNVKSIQDLTDIDLDLILLVNAVFIIVFQED